MEEIWAPGDANHQSDVFDTLPTEVFGQILSLLPSSDILNCRLVCRSWRDDPSMFLVLRKYHNPIHFRTNNDMKYFSWLMRTTPGSHVPFSKFAFELDQDIAPNAIQHFLKTTQVTEIRFLPDARKTWDMQFPSWKIKRPSWKTDYGRSIQTLLFSTSNLASLYLVVFEGVEFPAPNEPSCAQAFRNLKKFKVNFSLEEYGNYAGEPAMFQNIIKHSPQLKVLSLLYYSCFGRWYSHSHEEFMPLTELQKLPTLLSLLPSTSTKVKLRLGSVTPSLETVFNQLIKLTPQPRIVALAISLPTKLNFELKSSIWKWIQSLRLSKLKFFETDEHYDNIPHLFTNPLNTVRQLRLNTVTSITSNNAHFLFPNLKKLSVCLRKPSRLSSSLHPDFYAFYSLVKNLPQLESLKLRESSWEVLTGEPYYSNDRSVTRGLRLPYVLQRIKDFKGKTFGIDEDTMGEINKLKDLEIYLTFDDNVAISGALYASATGRLKRLRQLTFVTHDEQPMDVARDMEDAMNLIRKYHDNVLLIESIQ